MRANCILMILFVLLASCSKEEEERSRIDDGYIKFTFNNQNYEYNRKLNAEMNYVRTNISGYHNDESHVIQFTVPFIEANKISSTAPDTIINFLLKFEQNGKIYYPGLLNIDVESSGTTGERVKGTFNAIIEYEQDASDIINNPKIKLDNPIQLENGSFDMEITEHNTLTGNYMIYIDYETDYMDTKYDSISIELVQEGDSMISPYDFEWNAPGILGFEFSGDILHGIQTGGNQTFTGSINSYSNEISGYITGDVYEEGTSGDTVLQYIVNGNFDMINKQVE